MSTIMQELKSSKDAFGKAIDKFKPKDDEGQVFVEAANAFYNYVTFSINDLLNVGRRMQNDIIGNLPNIENEA